MFLVYLTQFLKDIMKESGVSEKIIVQIINNKPINLPKEPKR